MTKNIVVFGGGTGSSTLLKGLIALEDVALTAVVAAFDDGGSGGKLREQLNILPPGDPRVCLAATSSYEELLNYRFQEGDLRGHTLGNIFISALEKVKGDLSSAMKEAKLLFQSPVTILPVTEEQSHLSVVLDDESIVRGEDTICNVPPTGPLADRKVVKMNLTPLPQANPLVLDSLENADLILIAPGNVYASTFSHFLVKGIAEQIAKSKAKKVFVTNLFTKWGHLDFTSKDFITLVQNYFPIDYALVNIKKPTQVMLDTYAKNKQFFVEDTSQDVKNVTVIRDDFLHDTQMKQNKADTVRREILRHKYDKVMKYVKEILLEK